MKKNLKTVKTGIIFGLVVISMFAVFIPNASAGFIKIKPLIIVQHPAQETNIVPDSGKLLIELKTTFTLTGIGASIVQSDSLLKDTPIQIQLKVESKEDWIDASIDNPIASLKMGQTDPWVSTLIITVTGEAPAFQLGSVKISATSQEQPGLLFTIAQVTNYFDVSFQVGYWPVVKYEMPGGNLIQTGPTDTANFEIDLDNIGNGITYVQISPVELPKDWSVNIPSSVTLASPLVGSSSAKATIHLVIKPPYGFGFHNDRQSFKVQFTPYCQGRPDLVGQTETITFTVQSVGLSPGAGFEIPLIIAVLVVIGLILYLFNKQRKK